MYSGSDSNGEDDVILDNEASDNDQATEVETNDESDDAANVAAPPPKKDKK